MSDYMSQLGPKGVLGLLEQKAASIAARSAEKKAVIDPESAQVERDNDYQVLGNDAYAKKYGLSAMLERNAVRHEAAMDDIRLGVGRTTKERTKDGFLQAVGTAGGTVSGLLDLGIRAATYIPDKAYDALAERGIGTQPIRQAQAAKDKHLQNLREFTASELNWLNERNSRTGQVNQRAVAEQNAMDEARHQMEYEAAVANGDNATLAKLKREGKNLGSSAANIANNGEALFDTVAGQVPTLAIGGVAKGIVTAEQIAAKAATMAARRGLAAEAAATLSKEAAQKLATRNLQIGIGLTEGSGAYQQAVGELSQMSNEQLAEQFPEYAAALGSDDPLEADRAREKLMGSVGLKAAAIQGTIGVVTGKIASKFELDPLKATANGAGKTLMERSAARIADSGTKIFNEGLEETLQSGGGEFAVNAANALSGRENVDLLEGTGSSAGQGLVGGMGMAGAFQAPAVAANTAGMAVGTAIQGGKAFINKGKQVYEKNLEAAKAIQTETAVKREAASTEVDQGLADAGVQLAPDYTVGADSLDRIGTLSRIADTLADPELSEGVRAGYALYGAKTIRELRQTQGELNTQIEQTTDPAKKQQLEDVRTKIDGLLQDETVLQVEEAYKPASTEELDTAVEQHLKPEVIDKLMSQANELDPETATFLDQFRETAYRNPENVSKEAAERMTALYHQIDDQGSENSKFRPTAQDMAQVQMVLDLRTAEENHSVAMEQTRTEFPNVKTSDEVRNNIVKDGFYTGKSKMPSLREYVNTVSKAMQAGNMEKASGVLDRLLEFVVHMDKRAKAFDAAANKAIDDNTMDQPVEVEYGGTIDKQKTLDKKTQYQLILGNEKSRAAINNVFADSNLVSNVYNALAARYPELGYEADAEVAAKPTWQERVDTSKLGTAAKDKPKSAKARIANKGQDTSSPAAVTPVEAPVEASSEVPVEVPVEAAPEVETETQTEKAEAVETPAPVVAEEAANEEVDAEADAQENARILAEAQAIVAAAENESKTEEKAEPEADTRTVEDLRSMTEREYLREVNPSGKELTDEEVKTMTSMKDIDLPEDAVEEGAITDREGKQVSVYRAEDGSRYAVEDGKVLSAVVNQEGSTLNYTLPRGKGRGIGRSLLVEYLREFPFAPSGGFSPAGRDAYAAAFRALVQEGKPAMDKVFSSVKDLAGSTSEDGKTDLLKKNFLLWGFKLRNGFTGIMANGGYAGLLDRVSDGLEGLRQEQVGAINQMLRAMGGVLARQLKTQLAEKVKNQPRLLGTANHKWVVNKGKPDEKEGTDEMLWQFQNMFGLHATNFGQGAKTLEYDRHMLEGMVLGGLTWLMQNAYKEYPHDAKYISEFLGKSIHELTAKEKDVFLKGQVQEAFVTELASHLVQTLGLEANPDAPGSTHKGLSQALASEILYAMVKNGDLVRTKHFTIRGKDNENNLTAEEKGKLRDLMSKSGVFVGIATEEQAAIARKAGFSVGEFYTLSVADRHRSLKSEFAGSVRRVMGSDGVKALLKLVTPDAIQEWYIGYPVQQREKKIRSTNQKTSKEQNKILDSHNKVVYQRNGILADWVEKMGKDAVLRMMGFAEFDPEKTNNVELTQLEGINKGLLRSWDALEAMSRELRSHAERTGEELNNIAVHFAHYITVNNRVMMDGAVNPQSNKLMRDILMPTRGTMKIGDAKHELALRLMIGQALEANGIDGMLKIENVADHASVVAAVDSALEEGKPLYELAALMADPEAAVGETMRAVEASGLTFDGSIMKALNALTSWNAYNEAKANGESTVDLNLSFEQDGKTDGPSHLLGQFGLAFPSDTVMKNMARAGFLFNRPNNALGDVVGELKTDLYGATAGTTTISVRSEIAAIREMVRENEKKNWKQKYLGQTLIDQMRLMRAMGKARLDKDGDNPNDPDQLTLLRGFAKHGVTSTGYAGGAGAIAAEFVNDVLDKLYKELSEGLVDGAAIDTQFAEQINRMITTKLWYSNSELQVKTKAAPPIDFTKVSSYKKLELSPAHLENMLSHFKVGLGSHLFSAIAQEMGPALDTMQTVVSLTNAQSFIASSMFDDAYEARQEELVKEGTIPPGHTLSMAEENKLLAEMRSVLPVAQLSSTAGENTNEVGLQLAETNRSATIDSSLGERGVEALSGGFGTPVTRMGFKDPGVRAGALTIIGAGDATMMGKFFANVRKALNVWDGLEVGIDALFDSAPEINKAVLDAWRYDLVGALSKQAQDALPTLQKFVEESGTERQVRMLANTLRVPTREIDPDTGEMVDLTIEQIRDRVWGEISSQARYLSQLADNIELTKQALMNLGMSIDHMAGARNPFVKDGKVVPQDQLVEWLAAEKKRLRAERGGVVPQDNPVAAAAPIETAAVEPAVEQSTESVVEPVTEQTGTVMGWDELLPAMDKAMDKAMDQSKNKVHQFVWKQIRKLLPTDIRVWRGTAEEMRAAVLAQFPDAKLPEKMPKGVYLGGQVFVASNSMETLLHELVHSAITHAIDRYYQGAKNLTAHQKDAINELENLTSAFMDLVPENFPVEARASLKDAQRAVERALNANDVAAAVNEYTAWSLTNPALAQALQNTKAPSSVKVLAKKIIASVRKLLGLPNNGQMESFLEQTMGQFARLTRVNNPTYTRDSLQALFHDPSSNHERHLAEVADQLFQIIGAIPQYLRNPENTPAVTAAQRLGREQRDTFMNELGFDFDEKESQVFAYTQTVFASILPLDSRVTTELLKVRNAAKTQLTVEDLMEDPDSTDPAVRAVAEAQYKAMFGETNVLTGPTGRSTQLANFVALALVHDGLRQKLVNMTMPERTKEKGSVDDYLRNMTTHVFDKVADISLGISPDMSLQAQVDKLIKELATLQVEMAKKSVPKQDIMDRADKLIREGMEKVGNKALDKRTSRRSTRNPNQNTSNLNKAIDLALTTAHRSLTEEGAKGAGEDIIATTSGLWKPLRELFAELVGGTDESRPIHALLNEARSAVAQVRQRLRDETPDHVRELFSKPLPKETWARLVRSVGKTDLQALLGKLSGNQIQEMLADESKLDAEIARLGRKLQRPEWVLGAKNLASFMMTGYQLENHGVLFRNAYAIIKQPTFGVGYTGTELDDLVGVADRLTTLEALKYLSPTERNELKELFANERAGMHALLNQMQRRAQAELGKHNASKQAFNGWKGYVPESRDPRSNVVLAYPKQGKELLKQGYVMVGRYDGDDSSDRAGDLAYYAIAHAGGKSTWNQGAMQTVEGTISGVDHLTGRSLAENVGTMVSNDYVLNRVTQEKQGYGLAAGSKLAMIPVFNAEGAVIGYERPFEPSMVKKHFKGRPDLAVSIGMWMGRQAEEEIAKVFNEQVVDAVVGLWDKHKDGERAKEFVDISDPNAPKTLVDAWNSIPRETRKLLKTKFSDGPVMVRGDMLNNTVGYRSASVADAFSGMSDLPEDVQKAIVYTASALLGKNAYRILVVGERTWQGLIGTAKDVIVVRSGVVALANGIANQFQLVSEGLPILQLPKIQAKKVAETETYLRNAHRLAKIRVALDSSTSPTKQRELELEMQNLQDQNMSLSIWPLIKAGELPTIAEGLTEQDEYTLLADSMKWLENKASVLPSGVLTAAKYATISKDTALYQGMNRMIQFSDFTAKAALFDHLVQKRDMTEAEALARISERFVNYNLNAGRSRDYLESMGLTWFMAYKIRIQKIVLANIRENPARFLLSSASAGVLGADSLLTSSAPLAHWDSAMGLGMLFRADNALMWNQLFD